MKALGIAALLVTGVVCVMAAPASGQTITGTVIGDSNVKVEGAKVRIVGASGSPVDLATTDKDGAYKSQLLATGKFTVAVSAGGYNSSLREVTIGTAADQREDFQLQERKFLVQFGPRSGLDVTLAQPGTFTFFDTGTDDPGEVDLFADGKLNASVQLIGLDVIGFTDRSQRIRIGGNFGMGLGTAKEPAPTAADPKATKDSSAVLFSAAFIIDFAKVVRFETGYARGVSARETGTADQRDDGAFFVGLSLRTQLGNEFMKIFR